MAQHWTDLMQDEKQEYLNTAEETSPLSASRTTEQVGKVTLDLTHYSGRDLYSDGDIEDELLSIVRDRSEAEYPAIIGEKASWPILYHLSYLRENIVEWLPIAPGAKILEVGSGCGAITGALSKKAGELTCVELSKKRSLINASRHENCENITIHVGNFRDIEPELPSDYDLICLIGVFEYGQAYIGGNNPYEEFLSILKRHMAPGGKIAIAIESKLGMKYWAGCREDHLGSLYTGIEDYPEKKGVRTFTDKELKNIAGNVGFAPEECHMYYPYPDYKFMQVLFSDRRLPIPGECKNNLRNFDRSRLELFNEKLAFDTVIRDGDFPLFSNSYMMILGSEPEVTYARYSNDRGPAKQIKTVQMEVEGQSYIEKASLSVEAKAHLEKMAANYELLHERYDADSELVICPCELHPETGKLFFPFVAGKSLEQLLDECVYRGDVSGFHELFREYVRRISYGAEKPITDLDLIFSNILVDGDTWTVIDYEWVVPELKKPAEQAFRSIYCYLLEDERRNSMEIDTLLGELEISEVQAAELRREETEFQKSVGDSHKTLGQIREDIGNDVISLKMLEANGGSAGDSRVQIYPDEGAGFQEDTSFFVGRREDVYSIPVSSLCRRLRIDPGSNSCMVAVKSMRWNREEFDPEASGMECNGVKIGEGLYLFKTTDPGFTLSLKGFPKQTENTLVVDFAVLPVPENMAELLPEPKAPGRIRRFINNHLK